jgi:hypothetical protein
VTAVNAGIPFAAGLAALISACFHNLLKALKSLMAGTHLKGSPSFALWGKAAVGTSGSIVDLRYPADIPFFHTQKNNFMLYSRHS